MKKIFNKNAVIIYSAFIVAFAIICAVVFIVNYNIAYDHSTHGGFISPSFGVVYYYFFIAVAAVLIAVFLKSCLNSKIKAWIIVPLALIIPILCYHVNYNALKEDGGVLYCLVDEGGPLYFLRIGDYNFDGINDEEWRINNVERTASSSSGGYSDKLLNTVSVTVTGVGKIESAFMSCPPTCDDTSFYFDRDKMTLKNAVIDFHFIEPDDAKRARVYIKGENGQKIDVSQSVVDGGIIKVFLDKSILDNVGKLYGLSTKTGQELHFTVIADGQTPA